MQRLKFTTESVRKSWVIRVKGGISLENAADLREQLLSAAEHPGPAMLLDLSGVKAMDSSGVAVLIELHQRLKAQGRPLVLVGESEPVKTVVALLKAQNVICDVYKNISEGIRKTTTLKPPAALNK
jgi:anti-sigma B factor antagonist